MNRKSTTTDARKGHTHSISRRHVIRKIRNSGILGGLVVSMPSQWVKPVVDTILLPAHAVTTPVPLTPPTLTAVSVNVSVLNPSGNIGNFQITITSPDADAENPIVINSVTPSSGSISDFTPGTSVVAGSPLVLNWVSPPGFVDGATGIVLTGMFADLTVSTSGADKTEFIFTIAQAGDAP